MQPSVVCISAGGHRERVLARLDALVVKHMALVPPIARRIRKRLPSSFDLDEMIAVGNLALVRAATAYLPQENGGCPFSAYARAAITGAIKDTFRRNKFSEQTRPGLDNVIEFPLAARTPAVEERIDLARRFASLRDIVTVCLPPLQVKVIDLYYAAGELDLPGVAKVLGITRNQAFKAHAAAIRTLKERMKSAA